MRSVRKRSEAIGIMLLTGVVWAGCGVPVMGVMEWKPFTHEVAKSKERIPWKVGFDVEIQGQRNWQGDVFSLSAGSNSGGPKPESSGAEGNHGPITRGIFRIMDPSLGPLDKHLTNEIYYNLITSGIFEDVTRWYDKQDVDLIIICNVLTFRGKGKYVVSANDRPVGGWKEVEIDIIFHLLDPATGREVGRHDGKRIDKGPRYSPDMEDRLLIGILEEFISELIRHQKDIQSRLTRASDLSPNLD